MIIENPIIITNRAQVEIHSIIYKKQITDEYGLRVGLKGGGCSASYILGFDKEIAGDEMFTIENIKIFIEKKHLMYLAGVELDFEEGEFGKGFTFSGKEII